MRLVAAVGHRHCAPDQGRPDRHGYCVGCRVDDARLRCASLSFRESDRASLSEADLRTAPVLSQTRAIPVGISSYIKESQSKDARDCLAPMGTTSEAVAEKYGITREDQDAFACASHAKAKAAQDAGYLAEEIAPIKVRKVTPAEGDKAEVVEEVVLSKDEGIRPQTTLESLAKLKPCFKENGTGTAGNSSQISDGASAVTLVRRDVAEKLGLQILAKWVGSAVVGVPPIIMGVGPAYACPSSLSATASPRTTLTSLNSTRRLRPSRSWSRASSASTPRRSTPRAVQLPSVTRSAPLAVGSCRRSSTSSSARTRRSASRLCAWVRSLRSPLLARPRS